MDVNKKLEEIENKAAELLRGLPAVAKAFAPESFRIGQEILKDLRSVNQHLGGKNE